MQQGSYTITADDLIAGNRLHWRQTIGWKRLFVPVALSVGVLAAWVWVTECPFDVKAFLLAAGCITLFWVLLYSASWISFAWFAKRSWVQARKMWVETQVRCTPDEIEFKTERGEVRLRWSDFYRWAADTRTLNLYHTAGGFITVPLRGFRPGAGEAITSMIKAAGLAER